LAGISENKDKFGKIMRAFDIPLVTVTYKWHADVQALRVEYRRKMEIER
jgi:hypothetical protein